MKMTFRWYGENDSIPLNYIKQIQGVSGVVTALYSKKPGEIWSFDELKRMKALCNKNDLSLEVIESIPVHEDIKLGKETRDKYIDNYIENIKICARCGIKVICYNFMPVFDWLRTNLSYKHKDGSTSLSFIYDDYLSLDKNNLDLPGWDKSYSKDELNSLLKEYDGMSHEELFNNLVYFLNRIMPTCEEYGVKMAIHPDDPPFDIFNLPRIISNERDLDRLFNEVKSEANGLTFCTGSLGASLNNDLNNLSIKYAKRVYFLHLRQIKYINDRDFFENGHMTDMGDVDVFNVLYNLVINGFDGYVRPDHGRNVFGEDNKPGYGLYDRAMGASYLSGLFEAIIKMKEKYE